MGPIQDCVMDTIDHRRERETFAKRFGGSADLRLFHAPGRVNIIGEHLDYNGGYVFPAAVSMGIYALVRERDDDTVRMASTAFEAEITFSLSGDMSFDSKVMWGNYPRGVAAALKERGNALKGKDILFYTDLPKGSGLSSSAAMEVLMARLMAEDEFIAEEGRAAMAVMCQQVENEFIGVKCGIMDQFAVAMGRADSAILLRSHDLEYRYAPFELGDHDLMIINSNKPRALADSEYNRRREECNAALEEIRRHHELAALAEGTFEDLNFLTDPTLKKRARHVISENSRTLQAVSVLSEHKLVDFGAMMTASHRSLQHDYEVTGPELDALVDASLEVEGCLGARMTGAGFGGCTIALVHKEAVDGFQKHVGEQYHKKTGLKGEFYRARICDGAREIT